jgi:galactokinase
VNLIGEHTDYNDGFVPPVAINKRIYAAAARHQDTDISVRAAGRDVSIHASIEGLKGHEQEFWIDYPKWLAKAKVALNGKFWDEESQSFI